MDRQVVAEISVRHGPACGEGDGICQRIAPGTRLDESCWNHFSNDVSPGRQVGEGIEPGLVDGRGSGIVESSLGSRFVRIQYTVIVGVDVYRNIRQPGFSKRRIVPGPRRRATKNR